jgi:hypothetical protein
MTSAVWNGIQSFEREGDFILLLWRASHTHRDHKEFSGFYLEEKRDQNHTKAARIMSGCAETRRAVMNIVEVAFWCSASPKDGKATSCVF